MGVSHFYLACALTLEDLTFLSFVIVIDYYKDVGYIEDFPLRQFYKSFFASFTKKTVDDGCFLFSEEFPPVYIC